jgi:peptidyl-prolyl cis-trans isomerase SurA
MRWAGVMAAAVVWAASPASAQDVERIPSAQPSALPSGQAEGLAAIVNDDAITTLDVRQRVNLIFVSAGIEPTPDAMAQVRSQALRGLIDERLQLQEADRWKIEISDAEVDAAFANIARANGLNTDQMAAQLGGAGIGVATMKQQLRAEIAWQRYIGGRFGSRVRISSNVVNDTLSRIAANAARPQYLLSEIFLPTDGEEETRQAVQVAERLILEMRNGAPFPAVARQFSSNPSAATGGDIGWLAQGEVPGPLQSAVDTLQPGQFSAPIVTEDGVYVLALRDRRMGQSGAGAVSLAQISAPGRSRAALEAGLRGVSGCQALAGVAARVADSQVTELGEFAPADLAPDTARRIANLTEGAPSEVFETPRGVAALVVCGRTAAAAPDRNEIENRLYDQELAMVSQREMRNLREEATIRIRQQ